MEPGLVFERFRCAPKVMHNCYQRSTGEAQHRQSKAHNKLIYSNLHAGQTVTDSYIALT